MKPVEMSIKIKITKFITGIDLERKTLQLKIGRKVVDINEGDEIISWFDPTRKNKQVSILHDDEYLYLNSQHKKQIIRLLKFDRQVVNADIFTIDFNNLTKW